MNRHLLPNRDSASWCTYIVIALASCLWWLQHGTAQQVPLEAGSNQFTLAESDTALWAAPTHGQALQLRWVPMGGQCYVHVRVADLQKTDAGKRAFAALGPRVDAAIQSWQQATGIHWNNVDRLLLTFVPRSNRPVSVFSTVWLVDPAAAERAQGVVVEDNIVVCGPESLVQEVVQSEGAPTVLRRQTSTLRKTTDEQRHLTVLVTPSFLLRDSGNLFRGDLAIVKPPLEQLLTEDTQAAALNFHVDDAESYAELRLLMTLERRREMRNHFFDQFLASLAQSQERLAALGTVDPYWSPLADRWPSMLDAVRDHLRFAWEDGQAVVNLSLPAKAAHNLLLAGELLLAEDVASSGTKKAARMSIKDALNLRVDYSFSQQSFDDAFQGLIRQVNAIAPRAELSLRVDGTALATAGVTRNQELTTFRPGEKTVAQLLTLLAMRANPNKVPQPSEPAQTVIWTIEPDPERPDRQVLLVTTRQAAKKNGNPLPKVFRKK